MKVAAIVPAYEERVRIRAVLESLSACAEIAEIIVVDDGSREPVEDACRGIDRVRVIRHERNRGKAAAMETGAAATEAELLFFCDADLVGFLPEHASAIIGPVLRAEARMCIGVRGNPEQRLVRAFALNSGERCLPKKDWDALPRFYKKGYRIEAGINAYVWRRGRIITIDLPYLQTLREKKYGFWRGAYTRIVLSCEVGCAWAYALGEFIFRPVER